MGSEVIVSLMLSSWWRIHIWADSGSARWSLFRAQSVLLFLAKCKSLSKTLSNTVALLIDHTPQATALNPADIFCFDGWPSLSREPVLVHTTRTICSIPI